MGKNSNAGTLALQPGARGELGSHYSHDLYVERLNFFEEWPDMDKGVARPESIKGKKAKPRRGTVDLKV